MLKIFINRWIFLLIIIIFNLIIGLRTSIKFFHLFFWFLSTLTLIGFAWIAAEYYNLRLYLRRITPSKIEEDDYLEIEAVIENRGFWPLFNLVFEDFVSCAETAERKKRLIIEYLGRKSLLKLKYRCRCLQRGRYDLGPFCVYLFDPFGLFFLRKTYRIFSEIYVYPQTFDIQNFPELTKGFTPWFGIETSRVSGDEHEFFGIREYKPGDPIKKIHWLSTARKNSLIVKEFQKQTFYSASIVFNLNKDMNYGEGKNTVVEYAVKIAASVAKYLINKNVSLEIIAHVGEVVHMPFNKGPEHLDDIFRFLATAQAESRITLTELFSEFSRYMLTDSTMIVIMLDEDWKYLPEILSLGKRNVSLIPLVLVSSSFLYPLGDKGLIKSKQMKFPRTHKFTAPIFFTRGRSLEEPFMDLKI